MKTFGRGVLQRYGLGRHKHLPTSKYKFNSSRKYAHGTYFLPLHISISTLSLFKLFSAVFLEFFPILQIIPGFQLFILTFNYSALCNYFHCTNGKWVACICSCKRKKNHLFSRVQNAWHFFLPKNIFFSRMLFFPKKIFF